jgi:HAD superfamily hydrolase (TIGR01509 family)
VPGRASADLRGVLLDVDGTLVDTTYLHAACWGEALRQGGHDIPMARVHRGIGLGSDELLSHLLGDSVEGADELNAAHLALYKQYWGRLRPLPGARELVRRCKSAGLTVVLASSASEEELAALRSALDADEWIDVATSSSDADAGKPHPDILQAALDSASLPASAVVFVGDAIWDGQACGKLDIPFVGVECGGTSEAELRENGAVEVWRDPADLLDHAAESVIFR